MIKRKKGFTLIELMIVVAIIGILFVLAIPKLLTLLETSRERVTQNNLKTIRAAISQYYASRNGERPVNLAVDLEGFLNPIPPAKATPLGNINTVVTADGIPSVPGKGWAYVTNQNSPEYGNIFINSNAKDTRGVSFTTY